MRFTRHSSARGLGRSTAIRLAATSLILSSAIAAATGASTVQGVGSDMTLLTPFQPNLSSDELTFGNALRVYAPGLKVFDSRAYFWANNGATGFEPYSTDGTMAGTTALGDLNTNPGNSASSLLGVSDSFSNTSQWQLHGYSEFFETGGKVYFAADDGSAGDSCGTKRLFVTDGTSQAVDVRLLTGAIVNPAPSSPTDPFLGNIVGASDGVVYVHQRTKCNFSNGYKIGDASQLWSFDGDAKTLAEVRSADGSLSPQQQGISVGDTTYVAATAWNFDGGSPSLPTYVSGSTAVYRLDGATATKIAPDAAYQSFTFPFTDGTNVYYFARVDASTRKVFKIPPTGAASSVSIDPSGGNFLPTAHPLRMADGKYLVSGTVGGSSTVALLTDLNGTNTVLETLTNGDLITDHAQLDGVDYFIVGRKLGKYENGALTVLTFTPAITEINGLNVVNGTLVFAGSDSQQVYRLFTSDGTASGTAEFASVPQATGGNGVARTGYAPYLGSNSVGTSSPAWTVLGNRILAIGTSGSHHRLYESPLPISAPSAPSIDSIVAGDRSLSVNFSAPSSNGGATITNYEYSIDGGTTFTPRNPVSVLGPIEITGLTNGTSYSVQIRAVNSAGVGTASGTVTGTPVDPAGDSSGGSSGDSSSGSSGGSSSGSSSSGSTTTTAAAPAAGGDAPSSGSTTTPQAPTLVTAENQEILTATVGTAKILIDGELVEVDLVQAPEALRRTAAGARTFTEVRALQTLAQDMVAAVQAVVGAGVTLPITIANTSTGATITGLVTDPVTGLPMAVPVEDVLLIVNDKLALMVGGADGANDPANIAFDGVIEFGQGGFVAVLAYGLTPGQTGEVVVMSTPQLLEQFEVAADGSVAAQAQVPADIAPGDHTVVVTVGDQAASLGFRVLAPGVLPSTGGDSTPLPWAVLVLAAGGLAVLAVTRRRTVI